MSTRGSAAITALVVVGALALLFAVAIQARTGDLAFEGRSLDRVCARWAAESAVAQLRAQISAGVTPSRIRGRLAATERHVEVLFFAEARLGGGKVEALAEGTCRAKSGERASARIAVSLSPSRGKVLSWEERAIPPAERPR